MEARKLEYHCPPLPHALEAQSRDCQHVILNPCLKPETSNQRPRDRLDYTPKPPNTSAELPSKGKYHLPGARTRLKPKPKSKGQEFRLTEGPGCFDAGFRVQGFESGTSVQNMDFEEAHWFRSGLGVGLRVQAQASKLQSPLQGDSQTANHKSPKKSLKQRLHHHS